MHNVMSYRHLCCTHLNVSYIHEYNIGNYNTCIYCVIIEL